MCSQANPKQSQRIKNRYGKTREKALRHTSCCSGGMNAFAPEQSENSFIEIIDCKTGNHNLASLSIITGQVHLAAVMYITVGITVLLSMQHLIRDEREVGKIGLSLIGMVLP